LLGQFAACNAIGFCRILCAMIDWHIVIKAITGVVIVPLGIAASNLWTWWMATDMPVRILTGIVVVPFAAIMHVFVSWWDGY
jgi:hypothetical protein